MEQSGVEQKRAREADDLIEVEEPNRDVGRHQLDDGHQATGGVDVDTDRRPRQRGVEEVVNSSGPVEDGHAERGRSDHVE